MKGRFAMSESKPKITPEQYRKALAGIQLREVYLQSCSSDVNREKFGQNIDVKISDDANYNEQDDNIKISHSYKLRASRGKNHLVKIDCTFCVIVNSKEKFTDDFFDVYKNTSLNILTWPYLRELVQNLTSRMNIPPLTLPLIKR